MAPASLIVKQFPYVMLLLPGQMLSPLSATTISRRRSSLTRAVANDLRSSSNDLVLMAVRERCGERSLLCGSEAPTRVTEELPEELAQSSCYRDWKSAGAGVR